MAKGIRTGGRAKGTPNKATVEKRERALKELAEQAKAIQASGKKVVIAKDELLELIPVVKGIAAKFQEAAVNGGVGMPGQKGFDREMWRDLKEWMQFLAYVEHKAADFQSPRFRAIAVVAQAGDGQAAPPPKMIEHSGDENDRERSANAAYLRLVKG